MKNLALNLAHRCGYKWALTKIVNRFDLLDDKVHILVISYRAMLTQSAQSLLEALDIHIVEVGHQVTKSSLQTSMVRQLQTKLATTIKSYLPNQYSP